MVGNEDSHFGVAVKSLRGPLFPKKSIFTSVSGRGRWCPNAPAGLESAVKDVCRERGKSTRSMRIVHSLMMKILMFCY